MTSQEPPEMPPSSPPPASPAPASPPAGVPTSAAAVESNGAAVTSLIFGILAWLCIPVIGSIIAIVTGIIGRKKQAKRGMATTGMWLGIINLVFGFIASIVIVIMAIAGVGFISEGTKTVSPDLYRVEITSCNVSASGTPEAEFDITNRDTKTRNFTVTIKFVADNGQSSTGSTVVSDVKAGETKSGMASGFELGSGASSGECKLSSVRNFFS